MAMSLDAKLSDLGKEVLDLLTNADLLEEQAAAARISARKMCPHTYHRSWVISAKRKCLLCGAVFNTPKVPQ